jgi:hypothetical protein
MISKEIFIRELNKASDKLNSIDLEAEMRQFRSVFDANKLHPLQVYKIADKNNQSNYF